jgi:hypothetical protein
MSAKTLTTRRIASACVVVVLVFAVAAPVFPGDPADTRRADRENDFRELVGDFKVYDACYEKGFAGAECTRYRLNSTDNPEYWPDPNVPPMKWPDAPKTRIYKPGMTPFEYFQALCKAEAGEFIYQTVKADSVYMIRPRKEEHEEAIRDRYGIEDPYGHGQGDQGDTGPHLLISSRAQTYSEFATPDYVFVETPVVPVQIDKTRRRHYDPNWFVVPEGARFRVFYFADQKPKWLYGFSVKHEPQLQSRYGYTWRGIRRPYDREMGIAGGETAVVDLKTNEIVGMRRGFIFGNRLKTGGMWWLTGAACPRYSQMPGLGTQRRRDKDVDYVLLFLTKVVIPNAEFIPGWDARILRHREELENNRRRGLAVPEGAMQKYEAQLAKRFGDKATYYDRLRRQGYPVDEYLSSTQRKGQP